MRMKTCCRDIQFPFPAMHLRRNEQDFHAPDTFGYFILKDLRQAISERGSEKRETNHGDENHSGRGL
jgi:hypothetical protein